MSNFFTECTESDHNLPADDRKVCVWLIVGVAIIFRLILLRFRHAVSFDEPHYLQMAVSLAHGNLQGFLHPYWSPGYPLFAALVSIFIKNYELAGRLANIVLASVIVYPVYCLARIIFNSRVAILTGVFLALFPPLAFFNTSTMAEPTLMLFGFLGIWFGWLSLQKEKLWIAILAGACWGLSYLAKPEGIGFLLVFLGFVTFIVGFRVGNGHSLRSVWIALLALLSFLVVASGYLFYLHNQAGYWTLSAKGVANQQFEISYFTPVADDVFEKLNADNTSHTMDEIFHTGTFLQHVRKTGPQIHISPGLLMVKYVTNLFRVLKYAIPSFLTFPIFILFTLGLFGRPLVRESVLPASYCLAFVVFFWFVLVPLFHINDRYMIIMLPAVAIWISAGLFVMVDWFSQLSNLFDLTAKHVKTFAVLCTIAFIFFLSFLPEIIRIPYSRDKQGEWGEPTELKLAGGWIRKHATQKPPIVMSYNKAVDFYAGNMDVRSGVTYSKDSSDRILTYAKYRGVEYFVVDERYSARFPNIKEWIDSAPPKGIKLVYDAFERDGPHVWVFAWTDSTAKIRFKGNVGNVRPGIK